MHWFQLVIAFTRLLVLQGIDFTKSLRSVMSLEVIDGVLLLLWLLWLLWFCSVECLTLKRECDSGLGIHLR